MILGDNYHLAFVTVKKIVAKMPKYGQKIKKYRKTLIFFKKLLTFILKRVK